MKRAVDTTRGTVQFNAKVEPEFAEMVDSLLMLNGASQTGQLKWSIFVAARQLADVARQRGVLSEAEWRACIEDGRTEDVWVSRYAGVRNILRLVAERCPTFVGELIADNLGKAEAFADIVGDPVST